MQLLTQIKDSILHLLYPHVCEGCGNDVLNENEYLCLQCITDLPKTSFQFFRNNPVEKIFWGRLPIIQGAAQFYFTKDSLMQHLMHQIKYRSNKELCIYLGKLMGKAIRETNRFSDIDALVPLPLFPIKEKQRGYNQAALLCKGMSEVLNLPVLLGAIIRTSHTSTQTHKSRMERWQNMEGRFYVAAPGQVQNRHILLVDDVVTTGASLEACGEELLRVPGLQLSVFALCYASTI